MLLVIVSLINWKKSRSSSLCLQFMITCSTAACLLRGRLLNSPCDGSRDLKMMNDLDIKFRQEMTGSAQNVGAGKKKTQIRNLSFHFSEMRERM